MPSAAVTRQREPQRTLGAHCSLRDLGGLYGSAMVAAGEGIAGNKGAGERIGFAAGPVDVAAAVFRTETASNTDYDQSNINAIYKFGFASLNFLYDMKKFGSLKRKMTMIGIYIPLGQGEIRAAYATNNHSGGAARLRLVRRSRRAIEIGVLHA